MYKIFDLETENLRVHRRLGNPFTGDNYIVARGWKNQGDAQCSWIYFCEAADVTPLEIEPHIKVLVGHNIKYDLLWEWGTSLDLWKFLKRGGKIWCTQLAEYLLNGQQQSYHMNSMDDIIESYGGRKKINEVKLMWEQGFRTSQIPESLLIDYLVGSEKEKRNSGDIGNTEKIYLGQVDKAKKLGMLTTIEQAMESLLATTEMEFNGLRIDVAEARRAMTKMEDELEDLDEKLATYLPKLPDGLEFNWASNYHKSYVIFGGVAKYKARDNVLDEDGKVVYKMRTEDWPLFEDTPINPALCDKHPTSGFFIYDTRTQDLFLSGKKKGSPKFKKVKVPECPKTKLYDRTFKFKGYTRPKAEWATALNDADGNPIYQTNDDIITELSGRNIEFLKLLSRRQNLAKDLGTYYLAVDKKTGKLKGMLTCVQPKDKIVHHSINHTSTVTRRLSSSDPNLQNIPRADTSEVKKMFVSRFGNKGKMMEGDFSQLEVVGQGVLSGDKNLIRDLVNKIDFHCKRVAAKYGCTYEEALYRCKDESYEDYKTWKSYRTKCKEFSFQRAYGAGAAAISASTGMSIEDVEELIKSEDAMYPDVLLFNKSVEAAVKESAVRFKDFSKDGKVYRRGTYQIFTGTKFTFRSYDAMDFQQRKGIQDSFMPTELKNYPTQGFCGEIVQIIIGKLFRHFISKNNYKGKAFMCNTVHDSVWFDVHNDVVDEVAKDVKHIMESVPQYLEELYGKVIPVPFPVEIEVGENMYNKHFYL